MEQELSLIAVKLVRKDLNFSATFRSEVEEKFKVNLKSVLSNERSDKSRTIIRGQFSLIKNIKIIF